MVAGGYEDWIAKRKERASPRPARAERSRDSAPPRTAPPPARTKLSYKDQRDYELLPARIEELDAAIARGEHILADPDLFTRDPGRFASVNEGLAKARAEKESAEERWLGLAEMVED